MERYVVWLLTDQSFAIVFATSRTDATRTARTLGLKFWQSGASGNNERTGGMNYTMKTPCHNCPFLKKGGIRLRPARVDEVAMGNGEFPCHKSVEHDDDGGHVRSDTEVHCAGSLIFHEKTCTPTQMMRICERLGMYDAKALMDDNDAIPLVFDSLRQMQAANRKRK